MSEFCSSARCPDSDIDTLKADCITSISHETRTPLSVILLSVERLRLHGQNCTEPQRQAYLN